MRFATPIGLLRAALGCFPRSFHRRFAGEMIEVFGDRCREVEERDGKRALFLLWCRTLAELLGAALMELGFKGSSQRCLVEQRAYSSESDQLLGSESIR